MTNMKNNNHNSQSAYSNADRKKQNNHHHNQSSSSNQSQKHQNNPKSETHHHHQSPQQQQQQHYHNSQQHQQSYHGQRERSGYRERSGQRELSGQRNQVGAGSQYPDSSMNRDAGINPSNLGSVRFTPGYPTRELPPIETKADANKKFTGRCRLFVGNLPHNTTEEKLRTLFEKFGEVGEVFLGPKSAFAFIKMDTRQNAENARDALDCSNYESRTLRVRLAAHAAAIRVKHLSPQVTNELLAYSFRYFGEIERAVVVVDDKGKSIGEGIVEYSKKHSALYAIKKCQQECFILTATPRPVLVEPYDQQDEDEGLPEKSINKNAIEYKEQRDVGPRFADPNSFDQTFALRWKDLYDVEKQKRDRLEQEIQEARKNLYDQIEYARLEHDTMQLQKQLQRLQGDRARIEQMKEQALSTAQQREDQRRQQDMLIRQREEEVLRRHQLGDANGLNQQESAMRMQATALQDIIKNQELSGGTENRPDSSQAQQQPQMTNQEPDSVMNQPNLMQPTQARSFAEAAMMSIPQQPQYIPVHTQQQMGLQPPSQNIQLQPPNMFTPYIPPQMQMQLDASGNGSFATHQPMSGWIPPQQQTTSGGGGFGRQQKYNKQYNNNNNSNNNNNGASQTGDGGRPRKRGRY